MNKNLSRLKLLRILADQYLKTNLGQDKTLGVSWDFLISKMNCSLGELMAIGSTMVDEKEIEYHDALGVEGLFATMKGVSAYSTNKYKRENEKLIFEQLKNWIQTLIPIISLVMTLYVIRTSEKTIQLKNEEIRKIEKMVHELENKIRDC